MKRTMLGLCLAMSLLAAQAGAQGYSAQSEQLPEFVYQGRLEDGGIAADGNYDLVFRL